MSSTDDEWLDVAAIAKLTGWSVGYVRKRSSIDGWQRLGTKPQQYRAADVTRSAGTSRDTRIRSHLLARHG